MRDSEISLNSYVGYCSVGFQSDLSGWSFCGYLGLEAVQDIATSGKNGGDIGHSERQLQPPEDPGGLAWQGLLENSLNGHLNHHNHPCMGGLPLNFPDR